MSYTRSEPDENGVRHFICTDCGQQIRTGHKVNGSCNPEPRTAEPLKPGRYLDLDGDEAKLEAIMAIIEEVRA